MAQTVFPYLLYEDVASMLDWLSRAFGFTEKLRFAGDDGTVNHAEMDVGGGASFMMGDPGEEYRSPKNGGGWPAQIQVYVDDVDAHYERAKAAGAEIRQEPADMPYGDRRYDAYDAEGHLWMFSTQSASCRRRSGARPRLRAGRARTACRAARRGGCSPTPCRQAAGRSARARAAAPCGPASRQSGSRSRRTPRRSLAD